MAHEEPRSEQQEELDRFSPLDERADGSAEEASGPQFTRPDGGGAATDVEPTEIADDAGSDITAGPEQAAMRIEEGDEGSGRVG
ncbi:hypothetical protein FHS29_007306 [Saccharothrix tamanrassetensis]|uniref:Uncharacterized protein n=1 Tax=Saccharothrix tamanrassetensis TaxID=1051531 RepID=A0A841CX21_9PSEU|nr:hypothetical protein [Saccharothrix tamanrassetensis]MBB5960678.1 hypothetical protein [Saccharothrix tamanrassetensis]